MAYAVYQALCAVKAEKIPASFFEPVCNSREEAEDRAFDVNAAKAVARAMRNR